MKHESDSLWGEPVDRPIAPSLASTSSAGMCAEATQNLSPNGAISLVAAPVATGLVLAAIAVFAATMTWLPGSSSSAAVPVSVVAGPPILSSLVDSAVEPEVSVSQSEALDWLAIQQADVGEAWEEPLHGEGAWGEDVFEWWAGTRKLTVYFAHPQEIEFVKVWGPDIDTQMSTGRIDNETAFTELWRWLQTV